MDKKGMFHDIITTNAVGTQPKQVSPIFLCVAGLHRQKCPTYLTYGKVLQSASQKCERKAETDLSASAIFTKTNMKHWGRILYNFRTALQEKSRFSIYWSSIKELTDLH